MEHFPRDILVDVIFHLLPTSSHVALQFVCKKFYQLVPKFMAPPLVSFARPMEILSEICKDARQGKSLAVWFIEHLKYPVVDVAEISRGMLTLMR